MWWSSVNSRPTQRLPTAENVLLPPLGAFVVHKRTGDGYACGGYVAPVYAAGVPDSFGCTGCLDRWSAAAIRREQKDKTGYLAQTFYIQLADDAGETLVWVEEDGAAFTTRVPSWTADGYEKVKVGW